MKKIILCLAISVIAISSVSAGDKEYYKETTNEYKTAVIDVNLDFEAERDGYEVKLSWDSFTGNDFEYYKIMKSANNSNPIYPEQPAVGVLDNQNLEEFYLKDWNQGYAYYRVCVISLDKSRTCSNVVKLEGFTKEEKTEYNEGYSEKKYKDNTKNKEVKKTEVKKAEKKSLDKNLQTRSDLLIKNMVNRLDKQMGDDNEGKIKKLESLNKKLSELKSKVKSERTVELIEYLVESINTQIEQYSTSDDIEEIFELLSE